MAVVTIVLLNPDITVLNTLHVQGPELQYLPKVKEDLS